MLCMNTTPTPDSAHGGARKSPHTRCAFDGAGGQTRVSKNTEAEAHTLRSACRTVCAKLRERGCSHCGALGRNLPARSGAEHCSRRDDHLANARPEVHKVELGVPRHLAADPRVRRVRAAAATFRLRAPAGTAAQGRQWPSPRTSSCRHTSQPPCRRRSRQAATKTAPPRARPPRPPRCTPQPVLPWLTRCSSRVPIRAAGNLGSRRQAGRTPSVLAFLESASCRLLTAARSAAVLMKRCVTSASVPASARRRAGRYGSRGALGARRRAATLLTSAAALRFPSSACRRALLPDPSARSCPAHRRCASAAFAQGSKTGEGCSGARHGAGEPSALLGAAHLGGRDVRPRQQAHARGRCCGNGRGPKARLRKARRRAADADERVGIRGADVRHARAAQRVRDQLPVRLARRWGRGGVCAARTSRARLTALHSAQARAASCRARLALLPGLRRLRVSSEGADTRVTTLLRTTRAVVSRTIKPASPAAAAFSARSCARGARGLYSAGYRATA